MAALGEVARFDNPVGGAEHEQRGALADVEAALARGGVKPDQAAEAIVAMGNLLDERDAKVRAEVAAMIAAAGGGGGGGGDGGGEGRAAIGASHVHAIMAQLSANPANFHQCTVMLLSAEEGSKAAESGASAAVYYAGGLLMATVQCITAMSLWKGSFYPSCSSSDNCYPGTWCYHEDKRCAFCGDELPLPMQVDGVCAFEPNAYLGVQTIEDGSCTSYNFPRDPNFDGFNATYVGELCVAPPDGLSPGMNNDGDTATYAQADVASWCETCVHPIDSAVNPMTNPGLIRSNLSAIANLGACLWPACQSVHRPMALCG
jgi:hypothetical protein